MKHLGVRNPWAREAPPPEDPLAGARSGRTRMLFEGRYWVYTIFLPLRPREEVAGDLALQVLGEFLHELITTCPEEFSSCLKKQQLRLSEAVPGVPCVCLVLGPTQLYAEASSTSPEVASRMAVDRLALALTDMERQKPAEMTSVQRIYGVQWARKV